MLVYVYMIGTVRDKKEGYETVMSFAMYSGEEKLCRLMQRGRLLGRV